MRLQGIPMTSRRLAVPPYYNVRNSCADKASNNLTFRRITPSDSSVIKKYVRYNTYGTCDYTIGGILMWVDYFAYEMAEYKDTLFIKGISERDPGVTAFSLPLGEMPLHESVGVIEKYCRSVGLTPVFSAIPVAEASKIADIINGGLVGLDGWSDYVYDAHSLATLQGKAYSKKRNHVNRFMLDNPDYTFSFLHDEEVDEAKSFMSNVDLDGKIDKSMAAYELAQCVDLLDKYREYGFEAALLRSSERQICALTVGEVVGETLYVHVEKMDHTIPGSGETVNKFFAEEMTRRYPMVKYINREEDMNDPGLAFAKESYHPIVKRDKCDVIGR